MERPEARPSFARSVAGILALKGGILVLGVSAGAIVARVLGPDAVGVLTLALLVPGTLDVILNGGIGTANAYYGAGRRFSPAELSGNSVGFAIAGGIGGLLVVAVLLVTGIADLLLPALPAPALIVASAGLPFLLINRYFEGILQGLHRLRTAHAIRLAEGAGVVLLLLVLLVGQGEETLAAVAAYVGGSIVAAGLFLAAVRSDAARLTARPDPTVARATLRYGLRGHAGNVVQYLNYRLDMFLVVLFLDPAALGLYVVAVRLAELLWHLPDAVGFAVLPRAASTTPGAMSRFTPRAFRATFALTAAGALVLALTGRPLIELIYSERFVSAYAPLLALLPGAALLGGAKVLTADIAGRGFPHYNSINAGIALVVTLTLDVLLIPRLGILGAAIASSVAYGVVLVVAMLFHARVVRDGAAGPSAAASSASLETTPGPPAHGVSPMELEP